MKAIKFGLYGLGFLLSVGALGRLDSHSGDPVSVLIFTLLAAFLCFLLGWLMQSVSEDDIPVKKSYPVNPYDQYRRI